MSTIESRKPVFSIIVPVFNAENYLEKSLRSILDQKFPDFELVLVNDSSADDSSLICKKFAALDHRIVLVENKENCGAAVARNQGIKVAKGNYLCFVDADDYIDNDFLNRFYDALKEDDYDFLKCGAYEEYYDREKHLLYSRPSRLQEKKYQGTKKIIEQVIEMEMIPLFGFIWNGVYRTNLVKDNNLWFDRTLKVNEDFAFNIQYLFFVRNMMCLSYCGYHYAKRNDDSLSSQNKNYDYDKHLLQVRSFLSLLRNNQLETEANLDKIYWMFTRFTYSALVAGTPLETIRKEDFYGIYRKHCFGNVGIKKKLFISILQSNNAFLIKPAVGLMGFVKHNLPVLFAKVKR